MAGTGSAFSDCLPRKPDANDDVSSDDEVHGLSDLPAPEKTNRLTSETSVGIVKFAAIEEEAGQDMAESLAVKIKRRVFKADGTVPLLYCAYLHDEDLHLDWIAPEDPEWLSDVAPELDPILSGWGFTHVDGSRWRPPKGEHDDRATLIVFAWNMRDFTVALDACHRTIAALGGDFEEDCDAVGGVVLATTPPASVPALVTRGIDWRLPLLPPPPMSEEMRRYQAYSETLVRMRGIQGAFATETRDSGVAVVVVWKDKRERYHLDGEDSYHTIHIEMSDFKY